MAPPAGLDNDKVGVIPPPPGVTPNFDHPAYHSGGIVPLAAVFIPLAAIFMFLRVYTKLRIIKVFGLEDWTFILAYLCTVFISIDCLVQQKHGNGIHMWDITIAKFVPWARWGAASVVIYVPAVGLAKVAILLFYLRLNPERGFRIIVYVALFFCTSYVFALSLAILLECNPVAKFWDPFLQGTCLDTTTLYLANAILNVIFDFVVLLVPVPMLLKLQTSARQKCVIAAIFSLGSITCVISAVRIYYQQQVVKHKADLSWHLVTPTSLVFVECNLSIICGCLMVLRPFLRRHFPGVLGGEYRRYNKSPGGDLVGGAYDGPHGPNSRSEYKTKISAAGYGKGSTLRSWPGGKNRSHGGDDGMDVGGDMELGRWGKKTGKSESEENIIVPPAAAEVRSEGYAPGILRTVDVDVRSGCG